MDRIVKIFGNQPGFHLDNTGCGPEMKPGFREFVKTARPNIDRLTVRTNPAFLNEERYRDLPGW